MPNNTFRTLQDVAAWINEDPAHRGYFFTPDTMRSFDSRMAARLHVVTDTPDTFHAYGVVSNRYRDPRDPAQDGPREYAVVDVRLDFTNNTGTTEYAENYRHTTAARAHASARTWHALHTNS